MSADLIARFGRRFVDSARERLAVAAELDGAGAAAAARTLALQLHSISGEAAMIGAAAISEQARRAMGVARQVEAGAAPAADCAAELGRLHALLDELDRSLA